MLLFHEEQDGDDNDENRDESESTWRSGVVVALASKKCNKKMYAYLRGHRLQNNMSIKKVYTHELYLRMHKTYKHGYKTCIYTHTTKLYRYMNNTFHFKRFFVFWKRALKEKWHVQMMIMMMFMIIMMRRMIILSWNSCAQMTFNSFNHTKFRKNWSQWLLKYRGKKYPECLRCSRWNNN